MAHLISGLDKLPSNLTTTAVMETTSRFMKGLPVEQEKKKRNLKRKKDQGMFTHVNRRKLNESIGSKREASMIKQQKSRSNSKSGKHQSQPKMLERSSFSRHKRFRRSRSNHSLISSQSRISGVSDAKSKGSSKSKNSSRRENRKAVGPSLNISGRGVSNSIQSSYSKIGRGPNGEIKSTGFVQARGDSENSSEAGIKFVRKQKNIQQESKQKNKAKEVRNNIEDNKGGIRIILDSDNQKPTNGDQLINEIMRTKSRRKQAEKKIKEIEQKEKQTNHMIRERRMPDQRSSRTASTPILSSMLKSDQKLEQKEQNNVNTGLKEKIKNSMTRNQEKAIAGNSKTQDSSDFIYEPRRKVPSHMSSSSLNKTQSSKSKKKSLNKSINQTSKESNEKQKKTSQEEVRRPGTRNNLRKSPPAKQIPKNTSAIQKPQRNQRNISQKSIKSPEPYVKPSAVPLSHRKQRQTEQQTRYNREKNETKQIPDVKNKNQRGLLKNQIQKNSVIQKNSHEIPPRNNNFKQIKAPQMKEEDQKPVYQESNRYGQRKNPEEKPQIDIRNRNVKQEKQTMKSPQNPYEKEKRNEGNQQRTITLVRSQQNNKVSAFRSPDIKKNTIKQPIKNQQKPTKNISSKPNQQKMANTNSVKNGPINSNTQRSQIRTQQSSMNNGSKRNIREPFSKPTQITKPQPSRFHNNIESPRNNNIKVEEGKNKNSPNNKNSPRTNPVLRQKIEKELMNADKVNPISPKSQKIPNSQQISEQKPLNHRSPRGYHQNNKNEEISTPTKIKNQTKKQLMKDNETGKNSMKKNNTNQIQQAKEPFEFQLLRNFREQTQVKMNFSSRSLEIFKRILPLAVSRIVTVTNQSCISNAFIKIKSSKTSKPKSENSQKTKKHFVCIFSSIFKSIKARKIREAFEEISLPKSNKKKSQQVKKVPKVFKPNPVEKIKSKQAHQNLKTSNSVLQLKSVFLYWKLFSLKKLKVRENLSEAFLRILGNEKSKNINSSAGIHSRRNRTESNPISLPPDHQLKNIPHQNKDKDNSRLLEQQLKKLSRKFQEEIEQLKFRKEELKQLNSQHKYQVEFKTNKTTELKQIIQNQPKEEHQEQMAVDKDHTKLPKLALIYQNVLKDKNLQIDASVLVENNEDVKGNQLVQKWLVMMENTKLRDWVDFYEGNAKQVSKKRENLEQECVVGTNLVRSYIKEKYLWEWVHLIAMAD